MFATEQPLRRLLATLLIPLMGCATNSAPSRFLPSPEKARTDSYGGWVELVYSHPQGLRYAAGELIAVTQDSAWILGDVDRLVVPFAAVRSGKLTGYSHGGAAVVGYTFLGMLSTVANGWFLILTAPMWLITGTVAGVAQSHLPQDRLRPLTWTRLARFARFPQGLPAGIRLEDLHPKP